MNSIYKDSLSILYQGNALEMLKNIENESIDVIITDPPYFLSNGGITCKNGKMVSVDKGDWDKVPDAITQEEFYSQFLVECKRILKPNGTIFIFGSLHNIYTVGYLLGQLEFRILNNITWEKTNPAPNLGCRMFTHSTETIIWASRSTQAKHYFNYQLMKSINNDKQMKDVWTSATTPPSEKKYGKHPTQKPLWLIKRLIQASTNEGDTILDPFVGSGTTMIAATELKRQNIGIELDLNYIEIIKERLKSVDNKLI